MKLDSSIIASQLQQPQPVEAITFMNGDLFKAAQDGNMEAFNQYQGGDLHCLVHGRRNTALHIYSTTGGLTVITNFGVKGELSIHFVEHLLDKSPSLLLQPNDKGEIPLHLAARFGNHEIVEFLIKRAKEMPLPLPQQHEDLEEGTGSWLRKMLRIKDNEGNTAFHKEVESCNIQVVQELVKELDPDFSFSRNENGETPIYIAAKTCPNDDVVDAILDQCKSIDLDYGGPAGRTALHEAVVAFDYEEGLDSCTFAKLIKVKKQLTIQADDQGRTPLHYVAHVGNRSAVELMLKTDASAAYMIEKERGMTALHMAAWRGEAEIMEDIISNSPGCCEIVDKNGWNFLHYAAVSLEPEQLCRVCEISLNADFYAQKDVNGNTPNDVLIAFRYPRRASRVFKFFYFYSKYSHPRQSSSSQHVLKSLDYRRLDRSMTDLDAEKSKRKIQICEIMEQICNDVRVAGIPPHGSFHENIEDDVDEDADDVDPSILQEVIDKTRHTHLLVAALIATVTFAAAIAVSGGYNSDKGNASDEGTATLSDKSAFKAFVITNVMAFVSSLLAIFLHFVSVVSDLRVTESSVMKHIQIANHLTVFAVVAMVVAFSTGSYAVLESSTGIAIATSSIGLTFFPLSLLVLSYLLFSSLV